MQQSLEPVPSYNLWNEPWISLERRQGGFDRVGIEETLLHASQYLAIYDPSPLVVVGIQRLLGAVLQFMLCPKKKSDLRTLWQAGQFPVDAIRRFASQYVSRFEIFSEKAPFLQSADLPLRRTKNDGSKTVAYLAQDIPCGTGITHYRHGSADEQVFCPACAAGGLVVMPAFATSGGAGIKPSINGVPPIYVIPGGHTLFDSLASSLLLPEYQPEVAWKNADLVWWARDPYIERGAEVVRVGFLHSLTFAARRVRLHPERLEAVCTRCGQAFEWGVRTMIFEMGECRPKDAPAWFDPFAAYAIKEKKAPTPIRPVSGKAIWREFGGLFLHSKGQAERKTIRPKVLDQMAELAIDEIGPADTLRYFRCVGLRTDMKAKVFEWVDAGFDVPGQLLQDENAGLDVERALAFSTDCAQILSTVFHQYFGGKSKKQERRHGEKTTMLDGYWAALAVPFREYVLELAFPAETQQAYQDWLNCVVRQASQAFHNALAEIGDDAASLRERVQGEQACKIRLYARRKKEITADE